MDPLPAEYLTWSDEWYRRAYEAGAERLHPAEPAAPLAPFLEALEVPLKGRALVCGAGEGRHVEALAGWEFAVTAIDLSPRAVARARALAAARGLKARWLDGDFRALPGADEEFDLVLHVGTFDLLIEDATRAATLGEARRVLRRGGWLLLAAEGRHGDPSATEDGARRQYVQELRRRPTVAVEVATPAGPRRVELPRLPRRVVSEQTCAEELETAGFEVRRLLADQARDVEGERPQVIAWAAKPRRRGKQPPMNADHRG